MGIGTLALGVHWVGVTSPASITGGTAQATSPRPCAGVPTMPMALATGNWRKVSFLWSPGVAGGSDSRRAATPKFPGSLAPSAAHTHTRWHLEDQPQNPGVAGTQCVSQRLP